MKYVYKFWEDGHFWYEISLPRFWWGCIALTFVALIAAHIFR